MLVGGRRSGIMDIGVTDVTIVDVLVVSMQQAHGPSSRRIDPPGGLPAVRPANPPRWSERRELLLRPGEVRPRVGDVPEPFDHAT